MRVNITLPEEVVRELDRRAGAGSRSAYIARAVERALEDDHRWELIESAVGSVSDGDHEWNEDAGRWGRNQRRGSP